MLDRTAHVDGPSSGVFVVATAAMPSPHRPQPEHRPDQRREQRVARRTGVGAVPVLHLPHPHRLPHELLEHGDVGESAAGAQGVEVGIEVGDAGVLATVRDGRRADDQQWQFRGRGAVGQRIEVGAAGVREDAGAAGSTRADRSRHHRAVPPEDAPVPTEYPTALGRTARRELALHGYTRYDQLTSVTAKELLAIHGVGPKAVRILTGELERRGMSFGA